MFALLVAVTCIYPWSVPTWHCPCATMVTPTSCSAFVHVMRYTTVVFLDICLCSVKVRVCKGNIVLCRLVVGLVYKRGSFNVLN